MIKNDVRERPVFICGHPKSGTSLVRAILDSHPQLIVYPEETLFFRRMLPLAQELDLEAQLDLADEKLIHIFKWDQERTEPSQEGFPDRDYSAISFEAVREVMHGIVTDGCRHPGDLLSAAVLAYGEVSGELVPGVRGWVEKSPYNEYHADKIFTWWPDARCIHILRDPRDNFVSYRRKHPDWSAEFFTANWSRSTRAGMENQVRYGTDRYLLLHYEELVQSPQINLRRLSEFLGIDWDVSMMKPTRAGEGWAGNSMFAIQFNGISADSVRRWMESLASEDAAVIEWLARGLMEQFGYPMQIIAGDAISPKLTARLRALTWPVRRRFERRDKARSAKLNSHTPIKSH